MRIVRISGCFSRGRGSASVHAGIPTHPPPGPGIPPETRHPLGADPPGPGTPLWTDTHLYKHNLRNFVADGNKAGGARFKIRGIWIIY